MDIDISGLTEAELVALNSRIVSRLNFLRDLRAHQSMLEFNVGQRVQFRPDGHPELVGFIAKYNRKSVTVITENGQRWNVAPVFLRKAESALKNASTTAQVIALKPR